MTRSTDLQTSPEITWNQLSCLIHLPRDKAARELGVSPCTFKKIYRGFIKRWPHLTLLALQKYCDRFPDSDYEGMLEQLRLNPRLCIQKLKEWDNLQQKWKEQQRSPSPVTLPVLFPSRLHPLEERHHYRPLIINITLPIVYAGGHNRCRDLSMVPPVSEILGHMPPHEQPQCAELAPIIDPRVSLRLAPFRASSSAEQSSSRPQVPIQQRIVFTPQSPPPPVINRPIRFTDETDRQSPHTVVDTKYKNSMFTTINFRLSPQPQPQSSPRSRLSNST